MNNYREIRKLFGTLPLPAKTELLSLLQHDLDKDLRRAAELMAELQTLGVKVPDPGTLEAPKKRRPPAPKYQSRKHPHLTWSGRGKLARWLDEEMRETGLRLEDFLIRRTNSGPDQTAT
ncbi:hypothetical protein EMQ25_11655 [Arsenicitalea aurantiaca]|uniref:DNA-binding protein H-NS-like C-terminal domain-containing protein n=1 Tax=Arsenicitalea aurantiaca TaxID=1783274 RepID=A0A433X7G6_9HYPH|nr:H-NS family nucleoid-associated regulatory protein [Arsenicitalea aurantiaca]RUT29988.1 hypothetical protein EMQ25_11655 [Arsenicitalea aurantiaca]